MSRRNPARLSSFVLFVLGVCVASSLALRAAPPEYAPPPDSPAIRHAEALGREGSWAAACRAYAALLAQSPSPADARWLRLWLTDATWRSEDIPSGWQVRQAWLAAKRSAFSNLLAPYANAGDRDDFWVAAKQSELALIAKAEPYIWNNPYDWAFRMRGLLDIADYLGTQPVSTISTARYMDALHVLARSYDGDTDGRLDRSIGSGIAQRVRTLFARASVNPVFIHDDRAWCALVVARVTPKPTPSAAAAVWDTAIDAALGTRWEPLARADGFIARANVGYDPTAKPDTPADLPALLAKLDQLEHALKSISDLPGARDAGQRLKQIAEAWRAPALFIDCPDLYAPGKPVKVGYGVSGYSSLRFMLYKVDADTWLNAPHKKLSDQGALETLMANQHLVHSWPISLPDPSLLKWSSGIETISDGLEPGTYLLGIVARNASESTVGLLPFLSSTLFVSAETLGAHTQAQLFRLPGFAPLANRDVDLELHIGSYWTGTRRLRSDAAGAVSFLLPDGSGSDLYTALLFVEGQPASLQIEPRDYSWNGVVADVFAERPLYLPGETAQWKVILRKRIDGHWRSLKRDPILSIKMGEEDLPFRASPMDGFGAIAGSVFLPSDAKPGPVQLSLTFEGDRGRTYSKTSNLFSVDRFQPPPVQGWLALAGPRMLLHPGGELAVRVGAGFYSGEGVPNAAVELKVFPALDGSVTDAEKEQAADWQRELRSKTFGLTTDSHGTAVFRLPLPGFLPSPAVLRVAATISVPGVAPIKQLATYTVCKASVRREDAPDYPALARPGQRYHFSTRLLGGDGKPCALEATVKLYETTWTEAWLSPEGKVVVGHHVEPVLGRGLGPSTFVHHWKRLIGEYRHTLVAQKSVHVGDDGRLSADVVLPREGRYEIECLNGDSVIEAAHSDRWTNAAGKIVVFAVGSASPELSVDPTQSLLATESPALGASALRTLAILPEESRTAVLTLSGETTLSSVVVRPKGRAVLVNLALPNETVSRLQLSLNPVDRRSTRTSVEIPLPKEAGLKARLQLPASPTPPGSLAHVDAVITGLRRGERASAALAVSDDAVFSMAGESSNVKSRFGMDVWPAYVSTAMSADLQRVPSVVRDWRAGAVLNSTRSNDDANSPGAVLVATERGVMFRVGSRAGRLQASVFNLAELDKQSGPPAIVVRRYFGLTAFWAPDLRPDAKGHIAASFTLPDSLTRWRVSAYVLGSDPDDFAVASGTFQASLPFQARLQLPATLVAGDTLQAGALLVNRTPAALAAEAALEVQGPLALGKAASASMAGIPLAPKGEARRSWLLRASAPGEATLTLRARAGTESDAMEGKVRVLEDGINQPLASASVLDAGTQERSFDLSLPTPLDPSRTQVSLDLTPSLAGAALDALPYLVDYPYGCVEQTMDRFLPAVVVKHALVGLGLDANQVEQRILAHTHRAIPKAGLPKLHEVIAQSLKRLTEAQRADGSFGWWPGSPDADNWMTTYVVWGLQLAADAGVEVPNTLMASARGAVLRALPHESDPMRVAWMLAALSLAKERTGAEKALGRDAFERCMAEREQLPASGRACLALASVAFGSEADRALLLRNLENGALRSGATGQGESAQWGVGQGYWRAEDGAVESTALTLLALLRLEHTNPLCPAAARWLVLNRRSDGWTNTRDTAFAVLALTGYLSRREIGNLGADVTVLVNGRPATNVRLGSNSLLDGPNRLTIAPSLLHSGLNTITLRRISGKGPVYALALASAWATGDDVRPHAYVLAVDRAAKHFEARSTVAGNLVVIPETLAQAPVKTGEQVEIAVRLKTPHDLEYVKVEIPKPAGCEPVNPLSAWDVTLEPAVPVGHAAPTRLLYRAQYDDRAVVFIDHLPAGEWILRLHLRAVLAGDFRLLPAQAQAMYAPEICGNSNSQRMQINE